jgi:methylenetetrahydrofolate reductase (NADPH)
MTTSGTTTPHETAGGAWTLAADLPRVKLSIELFPPKWPAEAMALLEQIDVLDVLEPAYYTVTSGAGGGAIDATKSVVEAVKDHTGRPVAAHLTCVGRSRAEINAVADAYWQAGIRHIVALRGDAPKGCDRYEPRADGYAYGADLVAGLKSRHPFEISVACYPEKHPEAASEQFDLDNLKRKVDAGADRVISQYCFDTEQVLRFRDALARADIAVPFVPGIMPIHNFPQIKRFSERCGAGVPTWLVKLFDGVEPGSDLHKMVAASVAGEQSRRLVAEGFDQLHIYALNRAELSVAVFRLLGGQWALPMAA